jgi:outer membrane receptor protein involved in Fe transport
MSADIEQNIREGGMRESKLAGLASFAVFMLTPAIGMAQTSPPVETLPTVEVIGTTPLPGTGIDRDKVPAHVQSLTGADLAREGSPSALSGLIDQAGSVNANDTLGDPLQPDILYRGFAASPVLGTPQGLAVYQNGVRINEAFGDTVNWDLIPDIAIARIDMLSSNPVYGLNALGGAVVVTMKNGFTHPGFEAEIAGGSFGQRSFLFEYGQQAGNFAGYIAGRYYDADGWRQFSPDHAQQLYADVGARGDRATLDIGFTGANNRLFGQGTTPVQTLVVGRSLEFTRPQNNFNQLGMVSLNGSYRATDALSFQADAYRREFHQTVVNGNTTNFTSCGDGTLCQSDGTTPLVAASGAAIPDFSNGGTIPIGQNDRETIRTVTWGGALQSTYSGALFGHDNNIVLGGGIDRSTVDFQSSAEIGIIDPSLLVVPSGFFVDTPEGSDFNATPVLLSATSTYYGLFATDTFNLTPDLAITASGRYNIAQINLADHRGADLTGNSRYTRFNPALGAAYKVFPALTAYAGYSEGNRAPTPSEIECANPARPCLLPSALSSDPPLKQVVSHTYEAGLRGSFTLPKLVPGRFGWHFGLFRTDLTDDIFAVATSVNTGFFQNIGSTRRQGIETSLTYRDETWSIFGNYSLIDATFQSPLTLPSPSNPFADANGDIQVARGNRLPGIPQNQLKVGADYHITSNWTAGGVLAYFSDQFLRGDESNQNATLPGYAVVNLHSAYSITQNFAIFAGVRNLFNAHYNTFGAFGDPTGVGAPGIPADAASNDPRVDNRFVMPAPPLSIFGGIRIRF